MILNRISQLIVLALILTLTACTKNVLKGSGKIITEERSVGAFTEIENSGPFRIMVQQAAVRSVTMTGEDNVLPEITTTVQNGRLKIYYERDNTRPKHRTVVISISCPEITGLHDNASGNIESTGEWNHEDLFLNISGSGEIRWQGNMDDLSTNISGSGKILLNGETTNADHTISGSGLLYGYEMESKIVKANISGSGNIELRSTESLQCTISGSGNIYYKGEPSVFSQTVSGTGKVYKR